MCVCVCAKGEPSVRLRGAVEAERTGCASSTLQSCTSTHIAQKKVILWLCSLSLLNSQRIVKYNQAALHFESSDRVSSCQSDPIRIMRCEKPDVELPPPVTACSKLVPFLYYALARAGSTSTSTTTESAHTWWQSTAACAEPRNIVDHS